MLQVFTQLHKLGVCMSHKSTTRPLDKLGEGQDTKVYRRREELLTQSKHQGA